MTIVLQSGTVKPRKGHSRYCPNVLDHTLLVHIVFAGCGRWQAVIGRGQMCNLPCLSAKSWQEFMKHLKDTVTILAGRNIVLSQIGIRVIFLFDPFYS